ncbi:MAG: SDR family NAD(P)-dependent oxidoreductase [Candidatus Sumerlaeota bacterium]
MNRLKDKVAIVTGASLGIGRAAALRMAEEGATIAATDIKDDEGKNLVNEINEAGHTARYWHMDTSDEEQVEKVMTEVKETFGSIDVLVNNAGISGVDKAPHKIAKEEWEKVMDVNVTGVFLCTKHAVPAMREAGGGSIINLSSIYGLIGAGDIPPYHASKGAVRLMSKNDALTYARNKIRVNSVHPAFIWTPLVEELGERSDMSVEEFREQLDKRHPIGHVGEPDDIAWGIVYLASDEAKFVTGSELVIDGGYTAQ